MKLQVTELSKCKSVERKIKTVYPKDRTATNN